jgi:glycogen debranching enzyme
MSDPWTFSGVPPLLNGYLSTGGSGNLSTLIEGSSFCISASTGNLIPGAPMGLFVRDTRLLSVWLLEVDGEGLEPLTVCSTSAFAATYLTRSRPRRGQAESTLLLVREREIGDGMQERIRIRNLAGEAAGLILTLRVAADFADLFEVKEGRPRSRREVDALVREGALELSHSRRGYVRGVRISPWPDHQAPGVAGQAPGAEVEVSDDRVVWHVAVPARSEWSTVVHVAPMMDGQPAEPVSHPGERAEALGARRVREWREAAPVVHTADSGLARTLRRSVDDLGALRIFDPDHPDRAVVAAGAPWFMALFGRDSLLTSFMVLPFNTELAIGTLHALAELQGTRVDPLTEEQPGRILHEVRFGRGHGPNRSGAHIYYGSADSTPLFVMLLGELRRWGLAASDVTALLPAADRALDWIEEYGDRDGDGFVEYQRATDRGLRNQGWKDSFDGISFADGQLAEAPIALAEVQAYVYAAYLARAHFAREADDVELTQLWAKKAADLKAAFNEAFWLPQRGWFAVGLDRDKRPIDSLTSNMGHCLWTGIVDDEKAGAVANHLLSPDLFCGWGVRTLARSMGAFNPMGYHTGSVWPHDNAIIAAGLARYGFVTEAQIVAQGILTAADHFGGRLPELFCGFDRSEFEDPVPYPTSCSPQAWAAGAPILLMRALLRMDPWIPSGQLRLAPVMPAAYLPMRLDRLSVAGGRASVDITKDGFSVEGLPPDVRLIPEPRDPHTALHA